MVFLLYGLIWANPASAQGADQTGQDSFSAIWTSRAADLEALVTESEQLRKNAESLAAPLTESVRAYRTQVTRLSSLFQASRGHPAEQVTLVQQMHGLQYRLERDTRPLKDIQATISLRLDEIERLKEDLDSLYSDAADKTATSADEQFKKYSQTLDNAKAKLTAATRQLKRILSPADETHERIAQILDRVEGSLTGVWEQFYLTPSNTNLDALASTPALLADWASSLGARMRFAYPQSADEWLHAAKNFVVAALFMAVLGYLALRLTALLPQRWRLALRDVVRGAWVWTGAGLSFLVASANSYGGVYFAFTLIGALLLITGVAYLSWRLRVAVLPSLGKYKPAPLHRLLIPAAIGVVMLYSDLPSRILGIVWAVVLVVFLALIHASKRKRTPGQPLPALEQFTFGGSFWFGIASLLVSFAGYARLSILLFMFLFAVVNTITLSNALITMLEVVANRLFDKEKKPVRNALADAAVIPLALVLALLCALPWLWAMPGAKYLLEYALSTQYTVGEANFEFSRILFIVLLFFLFRSFVKLGKTYVTFLPQRVPQMEKGVIPPLRTVLVYALWTLFALIVLSLLGVDFTSLAVVAGGLSVGVGLGMQNFFNNLVSGLMLIFGRTILVGDYVDVGGVSGTVRAINLRSTVIETPERALVYIPNSTIMSGQFSNWTRNSRVVRRSVLIGVGYGSDTEQVSGLLLEAAKKQPHVLGSPPPAVFFSDFGNNSLDFTMNVFIDDLDYAVGTLSDIRKEIERLLTAHNIDIPYPQLTLHVPQEGGAGSAAAGRTEPAPAKPEGNS